MSRFTQRGGGLCLLAALLLVAAALAGASLAIASPLASANLGGTQVALALVRASSRCPCNTGLVGGSESPPVVEASSQPEPPSQCPCNVGLIGGRASACGFGDAARPLAEGNRRQGNGAHHWEQRRWRRCDQRWRRGSWQLHCFGGDHRQGHGYRLSDGEGSVHHASLHHGRDEGCDHIRGQDRYRPRRSRWTITSGTKAYKGLHGKGTERENADYTISTLTGTVSR